jgi:hypothetical protein
MTADAPIVFREGRLYIARRVREQFLGGSGAVALLREGGDLLVLPVRGTAGGYILKIRNSAGDAVITAPDFFRSSGLADDESWTGSFDWREDHAALTLRGFFPARAG